MSQETYTPRQRVIDAINHREPDRIPYQLGCSLETAITVEAYDEWIKLRGLKEEPDETLPNLFYEATGFKQVPENILQEFKSDTRGFLLQMPDEPVSEITYEGTTMVFYDDWGIKWIKPEGSIYTDPDPHYFPLQGDLTKEMLDNYAWPDPYDEGRFRGIAKEAKRLRDTGCAVLMSAYGLGQFDMHHLLRGMEPALMDFILSPKETERLYQKITEIQIGVWEKALEVVGDNIDICMLSDDLGMQNSLLISPDMFRKFIKPVHEELISSIKKNAKTEVQVLMHSCGSVRDILPDLIEIGVDILNPIQVSANRMDTKELKKEFGKELSFSGGGCDTQEILPRGTPDQVRDEVKRRIDDLAPGGGFLFCPVHNIQMDVPPENLEAMWETMLDYGKY